MIDKNLAQLVDEIKNSGVEKGRKEASSIIEDAKKEAESILAKAQKEADAKIATAKEEADSVKKMSESAARQAGVSLLTSLKQSIETMLKNAFTAISKESLENKDLVSKMLVEFAKGLAPGTGVEVSVSDTLDVDGLTKNVLAKVDKDIMAGVQLKPVANYSGIGVQYKGESVKYEITDKQLTEMIYPFISEKARSYLFPFKKE